jgi:hypothetical protein
MSALADAAIAYAKRTIAATVNGTSVPVASPGPAHGTHLRRLLWRRALKVLQRALDDGERGFWIVSRSFLEVYRSEIC